MSLAKSVPAGLKPRECKQSSLCEPPPVPYVHVKDEVQEEVSKMQNLQVKTLLENKNTTLNFPVWHKNGTREAFLMHVTAVLDAIKKRGNFKDCKKAEKACVEDKQAVTSVKAGLALLNGSSEGSENCARQRKPR
jgi:hypothetical protein